MGHSLSDPNWTAKPENLANELSRLKKQTAEYSYDGEQRAYAAMMKWLDDNRKHTFTAIKVDPDSYDAYLGEYQLADGTVLTVSKDRRQLLIQQAGYGKIELFAESSLRFFTKATDLELMFVRGAEGKITKMEIYQEGQTLVAKKIK